MAPLTGRHDRSYQLHYVCRCGHRWMHCFTGIASNMPASDARDLARPPECGHVLNCCPRVHLGHVSLDLADRCPDEVVVCSHIAAPTWHRRWCCVVGCASAVASGRSSHQDIDSALENCNPAPIETYDQRADPLLSFLLLSSSGNEPVRHHNFLRNRQKAGN